MRKSDWLVLLLVGGHLWVLTQLRFEAWPEMLLIPYLQLNGFGLYRDMVFHYTPGLAWVLEAWFGLVGVSPMNLKVFTWGLIGVTDLLIYLIAAKRWGKRAGLAAILSFVALQPLFDGNGLWYELALTPLVLLAFGVNSPAILALAFAFKQSTFWFWPMMFKKRRQLAGYLGLVLVTLAGWFWFQGALAEFWFWPFRFIFTIFPFMEGYRNVATWRHWLIVGGAFGLILGLKTIRERSIKWLMDTRDPAPWALLGLMLIFPRFALFHLQVAVAFLALTVGKMAGEKRRWSKKAAVAAVGLTLVYLIVFWTRAVERQWGKVDRFLGPEVYQRTAEVVLATDRNEPVLLLNTPEVIYVLADRLPPKPWLTQFPWFLELPGFQERLIREFKAQGLRQVIRTDYQNEGEFVPGSYRPKLLLEYLEEL